MNQTSNRKSLVDKIRRRWLALLHSPMLGGMILMFFTLLALVLANSPIGHSFVDYWETDFGIQFGNWSLEQSLLHWINDALMAIFFFVIGMEIKREMLTGDLSSFKKASLPVFAALGGMLVPALLYSLINAGGEAAHGWGVPMATDIAFALGILILLGTKIPTSLKLLLTSIAVVDDIGAIIVIALFYTSKIDWMFLLYGGGIYALLLLLNVMKVRAIPVFLLLGTVLWFALLKSGIHATIAGVLLASTIPTEAHKSILEFNIFEFIRANQRSLQEMQSSGESDSHSDPGESFIQYSVKSIKDDLLSPLQRLEHSFHPWVVFFIVPLFAFANAGVIIDTELTSKMFDPLAIGIIIGLLIGKPIGIYLFSRIAVALKLAQKPPQITWAQVLGVGFLGGIGFTMSFFVSQLAFSGLEMLSLAKISVLVASAISACVGFFMLSLLHSMKKRKKVNH